MRDAERSQQGALLLGSRGGIHLGTKRPGNLQSGQSHPSGRRMDEHALSSHEPGEVREELPFHLRDYLKYEDLFRYGMTPQFVSRFESIVVLNDLAEADLAKIFVEPEGSIFRTSRDYFKRFGVDLQITRGALINIAWDASRQKRLGARALREIFRRVIRNLEFEPTAGVVTIDEQMVKNAITSRDSGRRER